MPISAIVIHLRLTPWSPCEPTWMRFCSICWKIARSWLADFGELPNGICRIAAPLTHELALTLPHWRECLRPIAAGLAQTLREALACKRMYRSSHPIGS